MKRSAEKLQKTQRNSNSHNKEQPQKAMKIGCLPFLILILIIFIIITFSYKGMKRDISNIFSGAADVECFFKDVKNSYLKNISSPDFILPLDGNITSPFGERKNPFDNTVTEKHTGIDIDTNITTDVFSSESGEIKKSGFDERFGNYIIIQHNDIYSTCYAHLEGALVKEGEKVEKGQKIGIAGETGRATGKHLHFEIRKDEERVDPQKYLPH